MRVLLADPPAFTPWYDHELAAALGRAGADVELATSHFRFGADPGGRRVPPERALLSALVAALPALAPAPAAEGRGASRRAAPPRPGEAGRAAPAVARAAAGRRAPALSRAVRCSRRTTCCPAARRPAATCGERLLAKFDRVVVHTERGRETLAELGIDARVIPHPVYPSTATRDDDGRTLLSLGVIRPYKGLPDAIEATRRLAGRAAAGRGRSGDAARRAAQRRTGRMAARVPPPAPSSTARCRSRRSPSFRTRPSSTSRARSCRRSGPGFRWSSTTWRASASRCAATAPGASCRPGDVDALTEAVSSLLDDADALAAARAGAERARAELTWDASAAQHLELYRELA